MSGRKLQDPEVRKRLRMIEEGRRFREVIGETVEEHERRKMDQKADEDIRRVREQIEEERREQRRQKYGWSDPRSDPQKDIEEFRKLIEQQGYITTDTHTSF